MEDEPGLHLSRRCFRFKLGACPRQYFEPTKAACVLSQNWLWTGKLVYAYIYIWIWGEIPPICVYVWRERILLYVYNYYYCYYISSIAISLLKGFLGIPRGFYGFLWIPMDSFQCTRTRTQPNSPNNKTKGPT
jgi:hypothetical protein